MLFSPHIARIFHALIRLNESVDVFDQISTTCNNTAYITKKKKRIRNKTNNLVFMIKFRNRIKFHFFPPWLLSTCSIVRDLSNAELGIWWSIQYYLISTRWLDLKTANGREVPTSREPFSKGSRWLIAKSECSVDGTNDSCSTVFKSMLCSGLVRMT